MFQKHIHKKKYVTKPLQKDQTKQMERVESIVIMKFKQQLFFTSMEMEQWMISMKHTKHHGQHPPWLLEK